MKLEDLIGKRMGISAASARALMLEDRVTVDDVVVRDHHLPVSRFHRISCNGEVLQPGCERIYLMLHKPGGILSATSDAHHRTVIDLIDLPEKADLHLAGRLDRSSTGLVLLTNDGNWSEALTLPGRKVAKTYLVETDRPIPGEAVSRFREGFHFETEGITTLPAELELLTTTRAKVILYEGRYHQIKRMFHRIDGIRLISLHREAIGTIRLPNDLNPGDWRPLSPEEIASVSSADST